MTDAPHTDVDPDGAGDEPVEQDEEAAGRPGTAAEEAGIVDQQAIALERMGEDARDAEP